MTTVFTTSDRDVISEPMAPTDVDLIVSDDGSKLLVYVGGKALGTAKLGAYRLVRPDHDAMIIGPEGTVWRKE